MTLSMYQASAPVFERGLTSLSAILGKAKAEIDAGKLSEHELMEARLAPDMFPLPRQVQIASDAAKSLGRFAGQEPPSMADTETSFAELQTRIAKTLDYVRSIRAEEVDGSEERTITVKLRDRVLTLPGQAFLLGFAMPNFYFHITTAYAILRHKGVPLTKQDFIGAM